MTNQIMCLKEFNNFLYIGTSSGLCRFNYLNSNFKSYDENNRKYWIRSIEEGINKNIWLSTSEGISQFDTEYEKFRFFDQLKDSLNCIASLRSNKNTKSE